MMNRLSGRRPVLGKQEATKMQQATQCSASEHSYALNSSVQSSGFHSVAKPYLREAIRHLVCTSLLSTQVPHIAVADLGCAYGRNTLDCAEFVVREMLKHRPARPPSSPYQNAASDSSHNVVDIQFFFSDLPHNDFNALFRSLTPYLHGPQEADDGIHGVLDAHTLPKFFAAGVPGSFYDRLFPTASLNLVICSFSLHWLSQMPPSLVDKTSPAWNGGHIWMSRAEPSKPVIDAYARQSEADVRRFLRARAEELTSGGILFLLLVTPSTSYAPMLDLQSVSAKNFIAFEYILDFLDWAWKGMVDEGLITSEMDMFNISWYFFNQQELETALKEVPELRVLQMEGVPDTPFFPDEAGDRVQKVEQWVGFLASVIRPAVEAYVGKSIADELFKKVKTICLNQDCFHARITHSLTVVSLQRL